MKYLIILPFLFLACSKQDVRQPKHFGAVGIMFSGWLVIGAACAFVCMWAYTLNYEKRRACARGRA